LSSRPRRWSAPAAYLVHLRLNLVSRTGYRRW
jgi:hypothetical protein